MLGINLFRKKIEKLPSPYVLLRKPCPFYGFHKAMNLLIDSKGNQCALIPSSDNSCRMEVYAKMIPNWNLCSFDTLPVQMELEKIADSTLVFPREEIPFEKIPGIDLTLRDWMKYVMNSTPQPSFTQK